MWKAGIAKTDITAYEEGQGMFGYGIWDQKIKNAATPLYARSYVLQSKEQTLILVCVELGIVSIYLKDQVVQSLQQALPNQAITDKNVLITAQHTHSGPAGLTQYAMYNLFVPGFRAKVFHEIKDKIVASVQDAFDRLQNVQLSFGSAGFDQQTFIGINRSVDAYNANPEITKTVDKEDAFDKNMYLLRIEDEKGKLIGSFNWFGLHTTCFSSKNTSVHFDNKGYAAQMLEKDLLNDKTSIHAFAQAKAGDVTPNHIYDKKTKRTSGPFESEDKNARHFGELQAKKAFEILNNKTEFLAPELDSALMYVDFSNVVPDPKYTNGKEGVRTSEAVHGAAFLIGTAEGPGTNNAFETITLKSASWVTNRFEQLKSVFARKDRKNYIQQKYRSQYPKILSFETGEGRLMGAYHPKKIIFPDVFDPSIAMVKRADRMGALDLRPWVAHILPIQIITIGNLAILGIAAEITSVAGVRLKQTVAPILAQKGIDKIIISSYANGYNGYITTPEEYMLQCYEGGHTVFGKWTLSAYQTKFEYLAKEMLKPEKERNLNPLIQPLIFDEADVWDGFNPVNQQAHAA